jgi:hypothetical protein
MNEYGNPDLSQKIQISFNFYHLIPKASLQKKVYFELKKVIHISVDAELSKGRS